MSGFFRGVWSAIHAAALEKLPGISREPIMKTNHQNQLSNPDQKRAATRTRSSPKSGYKKKQQVGKSNTKTPEEDHERDEKMTSYMTT